MRVLCRSILAFLALAATVGAARPAAVAETHLAQPYVGVTYVDRVESAPRPVHMHVVRVDLKAPGIRFTLSPPAGDREVVRETTLAFLHEQHAQVAINAHFFLPFPSTDATAWLIGIAASEGRVFSAFETPDQRYAIVSDAPGLNIDRSNRAQIVHRDPKSTDGLHVRESVRLWTTVSGAAQIVTAGAASVPAYVDAGNPRGALLPGGPRNYSNATSWYDVATARTAIALSRDRRTITLFTVDVRRGSEGMHVGEVASTLMRDYGAWDALNLDGGGSTSMAMVDPVTGTASLVNASSDNPLGRSVGSSLAVFARSTIR